LIVAVSTHDPHPDEWATRSAAGPVRPFVDRAVEGP